MKTIHTRAGILLLPLLALALAGCNGSSEAVEASKMSTQRSDGYVVIDRNNREIGTVRMSDGKIDVPFSFQNGGDEAPERGRHRIPAPRHEGAQSGDGAGQPGPRARRDG